MAWLNYVPLAWVIWLVLGFVLFIVGTTLSARYYYTKWDTVMNVGAFMVLSALTSALALVLVAAAWRFVEVAPFK